MLKIAMIAAASALLLAACSTDVKETPAPGATPHVAGQSLAVKSVHGQASAVNLPGDLMPRLTQAIQGELGSGASGGQATNLEFNVVDYKEVSGSARALAGMLGGSNRLHVAVTLRDPSGVVLRQFEIDRKSNPGALGAITDQEGGLITTTAKAIAETLAK
jgi:hypothetical protein